MRDPNATRDEKSALERITGAPESDRFAVIVKGGKHMGIVIPTPLTNSGSTWVFDAKGENPSQ